MNINRGNEFYDTENLIIEEKNGVENAYILSYKFDNKWVANYLNTGIVTKPEGKVYYSSFDLSSLGAKNHTTKSSSTCQYVTISLVSPCPCDGHISLPCYCWQNPQSFNSLQYICDSSGGSDDESGSPMDTDGGSGGGGGDGGFPSESPNDSNDNSETQANIESMAEFIEFKINKIITRLELNSNEVEWLSDNIEKALDIYDYVAFENAWSDKAQEFAKEIIQSHMDNTLVSTFPFIKYPLNSNYETVYPKFTEYLKNKLPNVANIPKIVNTIKIITRLSEGQIKEDLTWGKGPTIHITQLDNYDNKTTEKTVGVFSPDEPDVLHVDIDYVNELETHITDQSQEDAFLFFLGTTVLHEYVHYGDNLDGTQFREGTEEGKLFEFIVYRANVNPTNAIFILEDKQ